MLIIEHDIVCKMQATGQCMQRLQNAGEMYSSVANGRAPTVELCAYTPCSINNATKFSGQINPEISN